MKEKPGRILILGAGPAGLGAAWRLKELGHDDFLVLEASDRVGGLAASHVDPQGFTWDMGGHVEYSHYPYFDSVMERALRPEEWLHHERAAWVRVGGTFVPYPFQNNIHRLPPERFERCLRGLEERRPGGPPPRDFAEWTLRTFGRGVAEAFLLPYNRKVWACPLERLGHQWVAQRVSVPDLERVRESARLRKDDVSWGGNSTFRFPERGGTGAIWEAVADRVGRGRIRLGREALAVDPAAGMVRLGDGLERFDLVFSSMPLDALAVRVQGLPEEVRRLCAGLRRASTHVLGIGVEGSLPEELSGKYWTYFPDDDVPFYRAEVYSSFSPWNVPDPGRHWSLLVEVSEAAGTTPLPAVPGAYEAPGTLGTPAPKEPVMQRTVEALIRLGWIRDERRIVSRFQRRVEYGYPVPTLDRDAVLGAVQPMLEGLRVFSRGRFGGWRYEAGNQDHAFMQGVEWADRVVLGGKEPTYYRDGGTGA